MSQQHIPKYVTDCEWDSIAKVQSRIITIIDLYRQVFKRNSIPDDKQYWSMCGAHFNRDGPLKGELGHLTETGLISPTQFNGVDRELSIIEANQDLHPDINWFHGDFLEVMEEEYLEGRFNPVIINYDGVMQPKRGSSYLKDIMKFIDHNISDELLLIANFILINPYTFEEKYQYTIHDAIKALKDIYWIPKHWGTMHQAYVYPGSSKNNRTEMGMIMFIKEKHNPSETQFD